MRKFSMQNHVAVNFTFMTFFTWCLVGWFMRFCLWCLTWSLRNIFRVGHFMMCESWRVDMKRNETNCRTLKVFDLKAKFFRLSCNCWGFSMILIFFFCSLHFHSMASVNWICHFSPSSGHSTSQSKNFEPWCKTKRISRHTQLLHPTLISIHLRRLTKKTPMKTATTIIN